MLKPNLFYNEQVNRLNALLDWSFKIGYFSRIEVRVHVFLPFFLLLVCSTTNSPLWWTAGLCLAMVGSVFLHELGHALTASRLGLKPTTIMLHPFGGWAAYRGHSTARQELEVTAMGPAMNFLLAAVCWCLTTSLTRDTLNGENWFYAKAFISSIGHWNLIIGALNLIPALPLDGGRITQTLLSMKSRVRNPLRTTAIIGLISSVTLFFMGGWYGQEILLWFGLFAAINSYMILRSVKGPTYRDDKANQQRQQRERQKAVVYMEEVRHREKEREDRERLRKLLGESIEKD